MLIPLYGFVQGDTLGLLILAQDHEQISAVVNKLKISADVRVSISGHYQLFCKGQPLGEEKTVKECSLEALDRVDLRRVE